MSADTVWASVEASRKEGNENKKFKVEAKEDEMKKLLAAMDNALSWNMSDQVNVMFVQGAMKLIYKSKTQLLPDLVKCVEEQTKETLLDLKDF